MVRKNFLIILISGALALAVAAGAAPTPVPNKGPVVQLKPAEQALKDKLAKDEPVYITADEVVYNSRQKKNDWIGHVKVRRGKTLMDADKMTATSDKGSAQAEGRIFLRDPTEGMELKSERMEYTNKLKNVIATGEPVFTLTDEKGDKTVITGERLEILSEEKYALATGNVVIVNKDIRATGEEARYWDGEQKMELRGKPVVTRGNNIFTGDLITTLVKKNIILLEGNVHATIWTEEFEKKEGQGAGTEKK
jgi:lipopolysaccharide export system protein LptA